MRPIFTLALLGAIVVSLPARADVTAQDAAALAKSFMPYFGSGAVDDGIIQVAPHGQDYAISIDLTRALASQIPPDVKLDLGRWTFLAHPLDGGNWQVTSNSLPSESFTLPTPNGPQSYAYQFDGYTFSGVYDPNLATFSNSTGAIDKLTTASHAAKGNADMQISGLHFSSNAAAADNGAVSGKLNETFDHLDETLRFDPPTVAKQGEQMSVDIRSGSGSGDASFDSVRLKSLMNLWTFFVAHADEASEVTGQNDLKGLLVAALPIWNHADFHGGVKDIAVTTAHGSGGLKEINEHLSTSGVSTDTSVDFGLDLKGLTLPEGLLPSEFDALVPTNVNLALRLDDLDLDTPARALIAAFDPGRSPPIATASALSIFGKMANSGAHLSLDGGRIQTSKLDILIDGDISLAAQPSGEITLQAAGLDDALAALRYTASRNPLLREARGVLTAAKVMAKAGADDKAVWVIDYAPSGDVTVNGRLVRAAGK